MMTDAMIARSCSIWIGDKSDAFRPLMKMLIMPHKIPAAMTERVYLDCLIMIFSLFFALFASGNRNAPFIFI